jgi:hypothetical protein
MAELTPAQRRAALSKAAEARHVRAELLASVTSRELSLAEVFDRDGVVVKRPRVAVVLGAAPGFRSGEGCGVDGGVRGRAALPGR